MPGTKIDRYGHEGGAFVAPEGTPFAARGLPADYQTTKAYNTYEVVKPIEVTSGPAIPGGHSNDVIA